MKVKVTRNFQLTIPAGIREKLNLREGEFVDVSFDESSGAIIVKPYRKKWTTVKLNRRVTEGDIDEAIEDAMNEFTKDIG
jgi:AbrB family looped-hinge helix DNA binding protein